MAFDYIHPHVCMNGMMIESCHNKKIEHILYSNNECLGFPVGTHTEKLNSGNIKKVCKSANKVIETCS